MMKIGLKRHLIITVLIFCGCGGSKKKSAEPSVQVRNGIDVKSVEIKYFDGSPSISQSGDRVIFISGRVGTSSEASEQLFRKYPISIYKYDFASAANPTLVLSSGDDIGFIKEAKISPDGEWILINSEKDGSLKLFVEKFSSSQGIKKEVPVGSGVSGINIPYAVFSFGPNPLIAYELETKENRKKIYVVGFSMKAGEISFATPKELPSYEEDEEYPVWMEGNPGYVLYTRIRKDTGTRFISRNFNDSSMSNISKSDVSDNAIGRVIDLPFTASSKGVLFVGKPLTNANVKVPFGDKEPDANGISTKGNIVIQEEVNFLSGSDKRISKLESEQFNILKVSSRVAGDYALVAGIENFQCKTGVIFGSTFQLFDMVNGGQGIRIIPVRGSDGSWQLTQNPCEKIVTPGDGVKQNVDFQIKDAILASKTGSSEFKIVYQTWYSGDEEVVHLKFEKKGNDIQNVIVTDISNNKIPPQ
ncbi:MAG: PD40 domain-containing protein [Oligoflexales bacterium]|nr:PD40 domain-containing protein [Oligoflexales bacterium]